MKQIEIKSLKYQKTGKYHLEAGIDNQDAVFEAESGSAKIIAIADGVSCCENSKKGAEAACKAVSKIMLEETEYMFSSGTEKVKGLLFAYVYKKIREEAEKNGHTPESYSSTLAFVCINKISGEVMTFVLGDSLVYRISEGEMSLACSPQLSGDSKTYTTTTEGAEQIIEINTFMPKEKLCFLLATDGAWKCFYSGGVMSEKAQMAVREGNIIGYLEAQECSDDCSIVMMDVPKGA